MNLSPESNLLESRGSKKMVRIICEALKTWKKDHYHRWPHGAGKTTFAIEFLPNEAACPNFVNADLIAAGLAPPAYAPFRSGTELTIVFAVGVKLALIAHNRINYGWIAINFSKREPLKGLNIDELLLCDQQPSVFIVV